MKSIALLLLFAAICSISNAASSGEPGCRSESPPAAETWRPDPASGLSTWGELDRKRSAMLFLGSHHDFDPAGLQVREVRRLFAAFGPTLVITEGGEIPKPPADADQAVRELGEMGLVQWLASRCGIRRQSFDDAIDAEVADLLKAFPPSQVKLYYVARWVPQCKAQAQPDLAACVDQQLSASFLQQAGLGDTRPRKLAELDEDIAQAAPALRSWRDIEIQHTAVTDRFNPTERGVLNRIADRSLARRDQQLVAQLKAGLRAGERVLVIAGLSHMLNVMQTLDLSDVPD